jgi:hypothetical protein
MLTRETVWVSVAVAAGIELPLRVIFGKTKDGGVNPSLQT